MNQSLLIAVSENEILGYMIFLGSVKQTDYWSFITNMLKSNKLQNSNYLLIHDNAKMPLTGMVPNAIDKYINYANLPAYSPYLNIAENVFGWCKKRVKRQTYGSENLLIDEIN